jgi:hypothetical protein
MAGTILRLMPRADFDFGKVQASNSVIVWTSQNIDVSRYREGTMLVRVHALNIGTTATLVVALRAVQPSQEGSTGTTLTATLSADLSLKDD